MSAASTPTEVARRYRRALLVRGVVQGVGFRPAVLRAAQRAALGGFVRNDSGGVVIEIEGDEPAALARFTDALLTDAPPLARVEAIEAREVDPRGEREFRVVPSAGAASVEASIPPDAATCAACLRELFDPHDRRHRYPFINCTDCGPRFTIVRDLPYDRARTTMAAFTMCARCQSEYDDPDNRRFHAEPNACRECGPQLTLVEGGVATLRDDHALRRAVALLGEGAIVAIKGLGGYQLVVSATSEEATLRLRAKKRRPDKPFAVMVRDLDVAARLGMVGPAAREALLSPARPIVLVPRRDDVEIAAAVAPRLHELGLFLPATPLHHLLLEGEPGFLVVTSGNRAEEPIARDDGEAQRSLAEVADAFLVHDRRIHTRADDSVVRIVGGAAQPVRRARGLVPAAVALRAESPCVLAVGAQQKNAVCVTRGRDAFLSQHIGELDEPTARAFFEEVIDKLTRLLGVAPAVVAHDLHPDYASTQWALASGLRAVGVQHHHAHIAACLADNGRDETVIGVAFDGTGCGPAGDLWGGEILLADLRSYARAGHLRPLALAGGEAAIREPWRVAIAALADAGLDPREHSPVDAARTRAIVELLARRVASPRATGAGRWFDAAAAILGVRAHVTYDAQAAVELEALADPFRGAPPFSFAVEEGAHFVLDLRDAVRGLVQGKRDGDAPGLLAARFHATLVEVIVAGCRRAREVNALGIVALSGGCFQNRILAEGARARLEADGFEVLVHRRVPPNDGSIALGQAAVAAARERSA